MTRTENFLNHKFSKFCWKPLFSNLHVSCLPDNYQPIFFSVYQVCIAVEASSLGLANDGVLRGGGRLMLTVADGVG